MMGGEPNKPELKLLISAHSVYPASGAEGVVNAALFDQLLAQWIDFGLVTSSAGYQSLAHGAVAVERDQLLIEAVADAEVVNSADIWTRLMRGQRLPKRSFGGFTSRLVDTLRTRFLHQPPIHTEYWARRASQTIEDWLAGELKDAVVWARGTPGASFYAPLIAWQSQSFPLVVNYNDPMPQSLLWNAEVGLNVGYDRWLRRQNRWLAENAQAWTFPSHQLADLMSDKFRLERQRCFVIPHIVPTPRQAMMQARQLADDVTWILYAGTFYSSMFTDVVKEGLAAYAQAHGKLKFVFILKKPTLDVKQWIETALPGSRLLTNLTPNAVQTLFSEAQALLVADDVAHKVLMRTKVIETIHANKPVLCLADPCTTTYQTLSRLPGVAANPTTPESIVNALLELETVLMQPEVETTDPNLLARFAPAKIVDDMMRVMAYAKARFDWLGGRGAEPTVPMIEAWP